MINRNFISDPDKQLEHLIEFVNSKMSVDEYIKLDSQAYQEGIDKSIEIDEEQAKTIDSYKHEVEHKRVWVKYGIKVQYRQKKYDQKRMFTVSTNADEVFLQKTKEEVIKILKEVLIAPYMKYPLDEGSTDDLIKYEILSGNLTRIPTSNDIDRIREKYFKKI